MAQNGQARLNLDRKLQTLIPYITEMNVLAREFRQRIIFEVHLQTES